MAEASTCPDCGRPLSDHDRHVRFTLPDALLDADLPPADTWMSDPTPRESTLLQVQGRGAYVRALLPVRLTGGYAVTYGVWVGISPADLQRAFTEWNAPSYADLVIEGRLENAIAPWDVYLAPVRLEVRNLEYTPYCASSSSPALQALISDVWPHELVLGGLPA